jgi:hypothetical protein
MAQIVRKHDQIRFSGNQVFGWNGARFVYCAGKWMYSKNRAAL